MKVRSRIFLGVSILLLVAGLFTARSSFRPDTPQSIAERVAHHLAKELERIDHEIAPLLGDDPVTPHALAGETTYPFLVYKHGKLLYWSDNTFIPAPQVALDSFQVRLLTIGREAFVLRKAQSASGADIISMITLLKEYTISNDYLSREWHEEIFPSRNFTILEPGASLGVPVCVNDNCLFRISFLSAEFPGRYGLRATAMVLLTLSIIMLLLAVYSHLPDVRKKSPEAGLVYLFGVLLVLRLVMTQFQFPAIFYKSRFFDPQIFASSYINSSLGDLFLNVLAITALSYYLFRNFARFRILAWREKPVLKWVLSFVASLCILFAGLFPFIIVQTLYNNSAIVLDISQSLTFDGLRVVAIITVLLSGVSAFLFSHAWISILSAGRGHERVAVSLLVAIVAFAVIHELSQQFYRSTVILTTLSFLSVYFLRLYKSLKRLSYETFAYLFVSIFFLSANSAYAIQHFTRKEKIQNQFRFASTFLIDRDIFAEYLLGEASEKIRNDVFIQTRMMSPFLGKEPVRQKVRQLFLPSYFNKYDVRIFIFNSFGAPADNSTDIDMEALIGPYRGEAFRTDYENIYFDTSPETDITRKYVMMVPIRRQATVHGYVVVELLLKKIIPENVYPELLVDRTFQQFYHTQDLNYAVFSDREIMFTSGDYNYENFFDRTLLGNPALYTRGITFNGYDHIAQEDQHDRIAVVSARQGPGVFQFVNFSFLFVLGLLIILVLIFFQGIYNYFVGRRLFFSARIQLYLNLAFFVPLIIVSVTTLGLITRASQRQLDAEYLSKSRIFGQQISGSLNEYVSEEEDAGTSLSNRLADLAKLSNLDANLYNTGGELLATSQPLIFESGLISRYINPRAFFRVGQGENLIIEAEQVGRLRYFVAYTAIKSPQSGDLIGILGIPFFQSLYMLEKNQIVILTNILNIFAVIFIVLLVLSYFVSEWLTFPLRIITQSLRKTSLTKENHPLTWTATDEIGIMVKEYNSMLYKLSESKAELEQTQREKAWREIAQQVAHEIKNPLTPMKLTLQQLERALREGNGSVEKTRKAIATLLDQVDTLSGIASSFSGFARMPEPVIIRLELISLLKRVVDLHSPSGNIVFRPAVPRAEVMADEQLLSRACSNLVLNALQSGSPGQAIRVRVTAEVIAGKARIRVQDNGKGIVPEIEERIFLPHFSTKKSGSGLGLAISRQAIQQMGGSISFTTRQGEGTTFVIELPLAPSL